MHSSAVTFCPSSCNRVLTNQIGLVIVQDTNPETFYHLKPMLNVGNANINLNRDTRERQNDITVFIV